jgi:hypothetical protein
MERRDPHPAGAAHRALTGVTAPRTNKGTNQQVGKCPLVRSVTPVKRPVERPVERPMKRPVTLPLKLTNVQLKLKAARLFRLINSAKASLCLSVVVNRNYNHCPDYLPCRCHLRSVCARPDPYKSQRHRPPSHRTDNLVPPQRLPCKASCPPS